MNINGVMKILTDKRITKHKKDALTMKAIIK